MWPWRVKIPTQNLLILLLLLMLMMRIVLATVCCRFGSWGLFIKLNFCLDFEHKVWSRFSSWSSGKIWSWSLVGILLLMFCRGYEVESWSRFWTRFWILSLVEMLMFAWNFEVDAWSRFWRWNLIKICVWIRDMTSRSYFGKMNSILGSVVPLAMFLHSLVRYLPRIDEDFMN